MKGMESALSTARAARLRLRRNRAVCVRGCYGTKGTNGNFHLFLTLTFWGVLEVLRAFLKELEDLNVEDC